MRICASKADTSNRWMNCLQVNRCRIRILINGLDYYREELELEDAPVYDLDIKLCTELAGDMKMRLAQEESQEWGQSMRL